MTHIGPRTSALALAVTSGGRWPGREVMMTPMTHPTRRTATAGNSVKTLCRNSMWLFAPCFATAACFLLAPLHCVSSVRCLSLRAWCV